MYTKIYDMYASQSLGSNNVCSQCASNPWWNLDSEGRIGPVPIYYIGKNYINQKIKIVFVGSAGYGWDDILPNRTIDYKTLSTDQRKYLIDKMEESHYWLLNKGEISIYNVLRMFLSKYYGSKEDTSNICLTNLVRCNKGNTAYSFRAAIRYACAHQQSGLYITKREIDILKPNVIVGFCTKKDIFYIEEDWKFDFPVKKICLGHPSRKKTEDYVAKLIELINMPAL